MLYLKVLMRKIRNVYVKSKAWKYAAKGIRIVQQENFNLATVLSHIDLQDIKSKLQKGKST